MNINFEYYKIFYYVAKYKNITKAAAAMGSSQPNVTRVMKLLEAELNCRLFLREARGIRLTEEGERLFSHVEIAFCQLQNAQQELFAQTQSGTGTVEIGATETALHLFLLDALQEFKKIHPKVRIKIHNHSTPELLKRLANGSLDFAAATTPFQTPKSMAVYSLLSFQEILAGGSQYQNLSLQTWDLKELKNYPWVGLGSGTATYEWYQEFFLKHDADIRLDTEAATSDLLIPLIRGNMGIGFVPKKTALPFIKRQELAEIPLRSSYPEREIRLISDRGGGKSAASDELQAFLHHFCHTKITGDISIPLK